MNVDGTGNVLDLCRAAEDLERLAYVEHRLRRRASAPASSTSTSWSWARTSRTTTSRRSSRPRSGCASCSTRCRPRSCARRSSSATRAPARPRSSTARTTSCARSLARERMGRAMPQFGRSAAAFNVVPVDYVVAAMIAAAGDDGRRGADAAPRRPGPADRARARRRCSRELYAGRAPRGRVPAGARRALAAHPRGARDVRGHPAGVDRLPQPPGRLRRPADGRPAGAARPGAAASSATTRRRWSTSSARTRTTQR